MPSFESQTLAGYEILAKLGQGGMAEVYKAREAALDRIVALKVIAPRFASDPEFIARFRREATIAAKFSHPNLVHIYAFGESHGHHYLAMEFVEGESLGGRVKRKGRLDAREALAVCLYVAEALKYAWDEAGLIHRDVKPDNIFLSKTGTVKLGDLGLAKTAGSTATGVTSTGEVMGSPHYISPEQLTAAKDLDFRADIYSLGCTLYHLLAGQPPYAADDAMALMLKHLNHPLPSIRDARPDCPAPVAALLKKMMAKDRGKRHQSYEELIAELMRAHDEIKAAAGGVAAPPKAPWHLVGVACGVGVIAVAAALSAWWVWSKSGPSCESSATPPAQPRTPNETAAAAPAPLPRMESIERREPAVAPMPTVPLVSAQPMPSGRAAPAPPPPPKNRLAVLSVVTGQGVSPDLGETLAGFMRDAIFNSAKFDLVDRENIRRVFEEQHFSQAFADTTQSLVKAGKILDANRVLGGRVARLGTIWTLTLTSVDVSTGELISSKAVTHDGDMKGLLESAKTAALELVSKDKAMMAEERQARIAQWQKQIGDLKARLASLDTDEKAELDLLEKNLDGRLATMRTEVEALRSLEGGLRTKRDGLNQQHGPLRKQLDDLNAARAAIVSRYQPAVEKARATATSAQTAARDHQAGALASAAKLINNAIQYRNLSIEPIPPDGKYAGSFAKDSTTTEFHGEVFENMEETIDVGHGIPRERVGDIMLSRDGTLGVAVYVGPKPVGGGTQVRGKAFGRFPKSLSDAYTRQSFVGMYWNYSRYRRSYVAAAQAAQAQLEAIETESRAALDTWDLQNRDRLQALQSQLAPLAEQVAAAEAKLTASADERAAKEAVLNKPRPEQGAWLRQEITARFGDTRRAVSEELASIEAWLKAEAGR